MPTLRTFHLTFLLIAIVGADLFGIWAVWHYGNVGDPMILRLGILSILGGLGLIGYACRTAKRLDGLERHQ